MAEAFLINAIWLHQFDHIRESTIDEIQSWWDRDLYVKALDGDTVMAAYDTDPLHVINSDGGPDWAWRGYQGPWDDAWHHTNFVPWTVPRGFAPAREGTATRELNSDSVILDLEPYAGFWQATDRELAMLVDHLNGRPYDVTIDYRRLKRFPPDWLMQQAGRIIPQTYWTDFQRPPIEVLQAAYNVCSDYPGSLEMALPANGDGDDVRQALDWCAARNLRVSFWLWQSFNSGSWAALEEYRDVRIEVE